MRPQIVSYLPQYFSGNHIQTKIYQSNRHRNEDALSVNFIVHINNSNAGLKRVKSHHANQNHYTCKCDRDDLKHDLPYFAVLRSSIQTRTLELSASTVINSRTPLS